MIHDSRYNVSTSRNRMGIVRDSIFHFLIR